jgi:hypothetical protein
MLIAPPAGASVGASVIGASVAGGASVAPPPQAASSAANNSNDKTLNNSLLLFILFSPLGWVMSAMRSPQSILYYRIGRNTTSDSATPAAIRKSYKAKACAAFLYATAGGHGLVTVGDHDKPLMRLLRTERIPTNRIFFI